MSLYYLGLDLARMADFTALAVVQRLGEGEQALFTLLHCERFPRLTPYSHIADAIGKRMRKAPLYQEHEHVTGVRVDTERVYPTLVYDRTGVGVGVAELLVRACPPDAPLIGVTITAGAEVTAGEGTGRNVPKKDLVSALEIALQNRKLKIAPNVEYADELVSELKNFKRKVSLAGRVSFEALRESDHDDIVLAVSLALWGGRSRGHVERDTKLSAMLGAARGWGTRRP